MEQNDIAITQEEMFNKINNQLFSLIVQTHICRDEYENKEKVIKTLEDMCETTAYLTKEIAFIEKNIAKQSENQSNIN